MQAKLGAGFVLVGLLYLLVGLVVPRLELNSVSSVTLTASLYLIIGLGAAWTLSRRIVRRMRKLAAAASVIREGDLTPRIDSSGKDEIAGVARAFAVMTDSLVRIVLEAQATARQINASAVGLSSASRRINTTTAGIAGTAQEIARGAEEQAAQVAGTTETTKQLSEVAQSVSQRARAVHHSAAEAAAGATGGSDEARRAAEGIGVLTDQNLSASEALEGFREKASEIGELIKSITSISHQTHLLAINAAIEAARAGEEGRGFAVVAEEVSRLADNVRGFAEQISAISEEIMSGSSTVADQIRRCVSAAEEAAERVERTLTSFEGILTEIRVTAEQAGEIHQLTEQQREAAEKVNAALLEISRIARRNAVGTEEASSAARNQTVSMHEMARSAEELAQTSDQLQRLVAIFKLP